MKINKIDNYTKSSVMPSVKRKPSNGTAFLGNQQSAVPLLTGFFAGSIFGVFLMNAMTILNRIRPVDSEGRPIKIDWVNTTKRV